MSKSGIVNVRMVITEEKMLSNIDKVKKLINPNNKKQIVQLDDDTYFRDLIESVKTYLVEYPKKKNFPVSVYKSAYELVEFATSQFEENTKQIEDLIRQREANISLAGELRNILKVVSTKEDGWKQTLKEEEENLPEDIIETLESIGKARTTTSQTYEDSVKLVNARIANLESNLHIEIDMERIEDKTKALSYIGIEIADALKLIPTPEESSIQEYEELSQAQQIEETGVDKEREGYINDTTFEVKPSLWQKIRNSKVGRAVRYVFKIRVVLDVPALPEGSKEQD